MSAHAGQRFSGAVVTLAFLAAIALPLAGTIAGVEGGDQAAENRDLAAAPVLDGTWRGIAGYARQFDAWFTDHFAFRRQMVQWFGESRYFWLGVSPTPQVTRGKDRFLFYADDYSIDDYANVKPLTEFELADWRQAIVRLRDWLARKDTAFVFTIAPDKYRIYPEEFPEAVHQINPASRADQVYNALSDTRVVADVRPALDHAKPQDRLYYFTDTHWNDHGAYAAYRTIMQAICAQKPSVPPAWPLSDFEPGSQIVEGRDLAGMMGLTRVIHEDALPLVPRRPRRARVVEPAGWDPTRPADTVITEIPGSELPRAVVFRDSFGSALIPFLAEHFSRAVFVWENDVDPNLIRDEHPDVVLEEIVGRHLYSFLPSPELIPDAW